LIPDTAMGLGTANHLALLKTGMDVLGDGRNGTRKWDQHVEF
jgi:hypothetical protein